MREEYRFDHAFLVVIVGFSGLGTHSVGLATLLPHTQRTTDQELGDPFLLSKNGSFPAVMSSIPESNFNGGDGTVSPTPELSDIVIPSRPTDPLAAGLKSLLDPTIKQTTEKLLQVHRSQQELNAELTRLISREF